MKLTSRCEYALLALVYFSRNQPEGYISVETIALAQGIPPKFLDRILLALNRARYVRSSKGQRGGGYHLAKPANKISLAEIIRLLEGALAPTQSVSVCFYESTPIEKEKNLVRVFKKLRDYIAKNLEQTTLADVS
jgi:Rrf2 family protein